MTNKQLEDLLADSWPLEPQDIAERVAQAIQPNPLLDLLRDLKTEIANLRQTTALLESEVFRLRADLSAGTSVRISPYTASESLVRLS